MKSTATAPAPTPSPVQKPVAGTASKPTSKPQAVAPAAPNGAKTSAYGFIFPLPAGAQVTVRNSYGEYNASLRDHIHRGEDFSVRAGTSILAVADGMVVSTGYTGSRGNYVVLEHGDGYVSSYQHNTSNYVEEGDTVGQGYVIATTGNTGVGTGSHLHFELLKNPPRNKRGADGEMKPVQATGEPYFGDCGDMVLTYHLNPNEYLPLP